LKRQGKRSVKKRREERKRGVVRIRELKTEEEKRL
jgi:hypothetical protein